MPEKNVKTFIYPIVALAIFTLLIFGAGYAYFAGSTTMNTANYQVSLPKTTALTCTKTDCGVTLTPQMMYNTNVNATVAKGTSTCYLNCTCTGTQNAVCTYNVRLLEMGTVYTPSSSLGSGNEFTAKVTSPTGCSTQNSSNVETQVNTIRDKVVSSCTLTVPASGTVTANVAAEFKWYNLNLDQSVHANAQYTYQLTNDNSQYTVTFDPNGGSVGTTSKQVTYGEAYGTLPTPTWSGHTFRGWNGKNLLFVGTTTSSQNGITVQSENNYIHVYGINTKFDANYGINVSNYVKQPLIVGETYTLSLYKNIPGLYFANNYYDTSNTGRGLAYSSAPSYTFTIPSNFGRYGYCFVGVYASQAKGVDEKFYVQLEKGSQSTVFEPFYVTATTKVTQTQNHTLTAIWD